MYDTYENSDKKFHEELFDMHAHLLSFIGQKVPITNIITCSVISIVPSQNQYH